MNKPKSDQVKVSCSHLWKVFGHAAEAACKNADGGSVTRTQINRLGGITGAENVSLQVASGELFVIMGLSGSGKSTVLRCIAQLQRPSLGKVVLDGEDITKLPESALKHIRRHKMGMVFQNFGLVPHFTAIENIAFPLKVRGEQRAQRLAKANEMLGLVGLEGRGNAYPSELSGGQQQRVGIARSLAVDPQVWLLDEPFSALDPLIRRQLQDELLALQARLQKTIIFVTHDFSEAVRLADRIAIMRDGRIVQQGTAAELLLHPADDYVRKFVGDVSRLAALRLGDVMTKTTRPLPGAVTLPASMSLEDMLVQVPTSKNSIGVADADGNIVGRVDKERLLRELRTRDGGAGGKGSGKSGGASKGGGKAENPAAPKLAAVAARPQKQAAAAKPEAAPRPAPAGPGPEAAADGALPGIRHARERGDSKRCDRARRAHRANHRAPGDHVRDGRHRAGFRLPGFLLRAV